MQSRCENYFTKMAINKREDCGCHSFDMRHRFSKQFYIEQKNYDSQKSGSHHKSFMRFPCLKQIFRPPCTVGCGGGGDSGGGGGDGGNGGGNILIET